MKALRNLKQRYPVGFGLGIGVFLAAGAAAAAFIIYTGVTGSGTGNFATTSNMPAITISGETPSGDLSPGGSVTMNIDITNNDANNAHTITAPTLTFTSSDPVCASHLSSPDVVSDLTGLVVPAGAVHPNWFTITIKADATTPTECNGTSYTLNFGGTTSP